MGSLGIVKYFSLWNNWNFEMQLFARIRSFKDGITLFNFNINYDNYISEHSPAFQIELIIFNLYNHIWIYQNNYER